MYIGNVGIGVTPLVTRRPPVESSGPKKPLDEAGIGIKPE